MEKWLVNVKVYSENKVFEVLKENYRGNLAKSFEKRQQKCHKKYHENIMKIS
jgi:hypothetical protein